MTIVFYHNPRCSKSRAVQALLLERGLQFELVDYLKHPPNKTDLKRILIGLDQPPQALLRSGDADFKALNLDLAQLTREHIIDILEKTPKLMERPVVVVNGQARIGRPLENVESILP